MKDLFVNNSLAYITKHKKLERIDIVRIKYGLEVMYHFLTKTIVIILISYILGILKENVLIFICFGIIRSVAQGIHAKSNFECWIFSLFIYVFIGLYIKYIPMYDTTCYLLLIFSIISLLLFAPADTKNLPLVNKNKRMSLKIKSVVVAFIYLISFILIKNNLLKESICISLSLESILINPITYRITHSKFNNYKTYNC